MTPNTTYTIYGDTSDGYMAGSPPSAGDGAGSSVNTTGNIFTGQQATGPTAYEGFLAFDTSAVADTATITAVTLSLYGHSDSSAIDFSLEARLYDWGATLTAADWRSTTTLNGLPLLASLSTAGWSISGYNDLTAEAAFLSAINKTGFTRLVLCSDRHRLGTAPPSTEFVAIKSADVASTTNDPKLVIEAFV